MIEMIIDGILAALPTEQKSQMKSAISKVDEFMPMVDAYHQGIELKKDKNEIAIAYQIMLEKRKGETAIVLYQVILATNEQLQKPVISRTLGKWDITAKAKELTDRM